MYRIHWWRTSFGNDEVENFRKAIVGEHITAGPLTEQLEGQLAQRLDAPYAVMTTNGSTALLMSLMALNIVPGDEVIVPNRGWVATAHAVLMVGAKVILVDSRADLPIMDASRVKEKITPRTRAIIPVHLNGRGVDMEEIHDIAKEHKLCVIEDACQALFSRNAAGFLGTQSDLGCFSLGIGKLVSTGQGGFVVTHRKDMYEQLKLIRNHGVKDIFTNAWSRLGFNFKFTDLLASVGLAQLAKVNERISYLHRIYAKYTEALKEFSFVTIIPVDIAHGELPLYIEVLCARRDELADYMRTKGIQVRLFNPSLEQSAYIPSNGGFPNSKIFEQHGMFLPCGPAQSLENIDCVIEAFKEYQSKKCILQKT